MLIEESGGIYKLLKKNTNLIVQATISLRKLFCSTLDQM